MASLLILFRLVIVREQPSLAEPISQIV